MKKITTFLGCVGVVCLFSGCTSDNLESIVAADNATAEVSSSAKTKSSSTSTAPTSSASKDNKKPSSSNSSSTPGDTTVIRTQVEINLDGGTRDHDYYSSGTFCWSDECKKEHANESSSSAPKSSSSYTIDINMSQEAQKAPVVNGTTMTDTRDNQTYALANIGGKLWMASDLKYATADGSVCYESSDANCKTYGRLYTFAAAQKACPTGWRLPNRAEAQAAIEATNMPWSFSGRCSGSDCKYADGMGFHWTAAAQQDGDKMNVDQCSGSTAVIIVEKNPDSDYAAEPANFFQVDCQAKLFSVRCVQD